MLGRVVPYKRVELAVAACATLGRPLKVVGAGRALPAAQAAAGPGAEFLGHVPDAEVDGLLSGARALLFPGEEDFGIVPVEAQAAGVPVIAYGVGGVRDTVVEGETGVFHAQQTVASVASAILQFEDMRFDEERIRANARRFGAARFRAGMAALLLEHEPCERRGMSASGCGARSATATPWPTCSMSCAGAGSSSRLDRRLRRRRVRGRRVVDRSLRQHLARDVRHVAAVRRGAAGRPLAGDPEREAATNVLLARSEAVAENVRQRLKLASRSRTCSTR